MISGRMQHLKGIGSLFRRLDAAATPTSLRADIDRGFLAPNIKTVAAGEPKGLVEKSFTAAVASSIDDSVISSSFFLLAFVHSILFECLQ